MTKVLIRKFVLSVFILTFVAAPAAYASQPGSLAAVYAKRTVVLSADEKPSDVDSEQFIRTELFFGRNKPDGTEVSEEDFADFLKVTITAEFPDGLTVLNGIGQFRDSNGNIVQEKAKVLILLYPSSTRRQCGRKIERIRTAYKARFEQRSVLRVDYKQPNKVSF